MGKALHEFFFVSQWQSVHSLWDTLPSKWIWVKFLIANIWCFMLVSNRDGMNIGLDPDTSTIHAQNPTKIRGSIESQGPNIEGHCLFHIILTVPFSLWAESSWCQSFENCCPICLNNPFATTWHIPLNKAENIEEFFHLVPDTRHRLSLFVAPLVSIENMLVFL